MKRGKIAVLLVLIGGLVVRRKHPGEFPPRVTDLLQAFAAQSVIGLGLAMVLSGGLAASESWAADGESARVLSWALIGQPVAWIVGQPATDQRGVLLPPDLPPGQYRPVVGLYELTTGVRLAVPGIPANELALNPIQLEA